MFAFLSKNRALGRVAEAIDLLPACLAGDRRSDFCGQTCTRRRVVVVRAGDVVLEGYCVRLRDFDVSRTLDVFFFFFLRQSCVNSNGDFYIFMNLNYVFVIAGRGDF